MVHNHETLWNRKKKTFQYPERKRPSNINELMWNYFNLAGCNEYEF